MEELGVRKLGDGGWMIEKKNSQNIPKFKEVLTAYQVLGSPDLISTLTQENEKENSSSSPLSSHRRGLLAGVFSSGLLLRKMIKSLRWKNIRRTIRREKRNLEIGNLSWKKSLTLIISICLPLSYLNASFQIHKTQIWNKFLSSLTGYKCEIQSDGRIKVVVPYKRKSKLEPENREKGTNIFYITPRLFGPMPLEQQTKRHTSGYGTIMEHGQGLLWPEREEAWIKIRGIAGDVQRKKIEGKRGWEVNWEEEQGSRRFKRQTVKPEKRAEVLIEDWHIKEDVLLNISIQETGSSSLLKNNRSSVEQLITEAEAAMPPCWEENPDWRKFNNIVNELKKSGQVDVMVVAGLE